MPSLLRTALALVVLTPTLAGLASCSDAEASPSPTGGDTIVHGSALSLIQSFRFAPQIQGLDAKREPGALDVLWLGKPQATLGAPTTPLNAEPRDRRVIEASPGVMLTATPTGFAITSPPLSRKLAAKQAKVTLPARLDTGFTVVDEGTKLGIDVKLVGATPSEGKIAETGLLVYENGYGQGRHIVHRPHAEGVEDYVVFEQRPKVEELRYEVQVPKKAGLRLVSNVLEVVDEGGAPRLRMAAPAVVQRDGVQVVPTVRVEGCAVDADTRLPWGRSVTAPGAEVCSVVVGWAAGAYPVIVDPAWTTTGSMATARIGHTATLLPSGKVLVAGGSNSGYLASVEVYDPATGTWTSGPDMTMARSNHTATALASGNVLVAGGPGSGDLVTSEVYDSATGAWASTSNMKAAREFHTATLLPSGKILVAGGGRGESLASTEEYDPASNTWTSGPDMATAHSWHTATLLASGKVLVAGGQSGGKGLASVEVYDPASNTWTSTGSLKTGRGLHTATLLPSDKVLVTGGLMNKTSEVYDPATGSWTAGPDMRTWRSYHTATLLPSGNVLVAGGFGVEVEVYDSVTGAWSSGPDMKTGRFFHTATLLLSGNVLVTGGSNSNNEYFASAEVYDPEILGGTCSQNGNCAAGSVCNAATKTCEAAPAEGSDEGGCGCEVPRSSRSTTWPGLAVAGLALASLRRRSRR